MPYKPKKGENTPPHVPTAERIELVENLVQAGVTQSQIAQVLDICLETLRKHYMPQLQKAKQELAGKVMRRFKRFMFDEEVNDAVSLKACETYANAHMGWKQHSQVDQNTTLKADEETVNQLKNLSVNDLINMGKGLDKLEG